MTKPTKRKPATTTLGRRQRLAGVGYERPQSLSWRIKGMVELLEQKKGQPVSFRKFRRANQLAVAVIYFHAERKNLDRADKEELKTVFRAMSNHATAGYDMTVVCVGFQAPEEKAQGVDSKRAKACRAFLRDLTNKAKGHVDSGFALVSPRLEARAGDFAKEMLPHDVPKLKNPSLRLAVVTAWHLRPGKDVHDAYGRYKKARRTEFNKPFVEWKNLVSRAAIENALDHPENVHETARPVKTITKYRRDYKRDTGPGGKALGTLDGTWRDFYREARQNVLGGFALIGGGDQGGGVNASAAGARIKVVNLLKTWVRELIQPSLLRSRRTLEAELTQLKRGPVRKTKEEQETLWDYERRLKWIDQQISALKSQMKPKPVYTNFE